MGSGVVIAAVQCQRISRATGQHDLIACHPARDLRQAHGITGDPCGIDRKTDRKLWIVGHHLGGFGESLFKRIGGVVAGLAHGSVIRTSARRCKGKRVAFGRAGAQDSRIIGID
jgi:hypothetical protein